MNDLSTWQVLLIAAVGYYFVRPLISGYLKGSRGADERPSPPKSQSAQSPPTNSKHRWPELGRYELEVVGESHYQSVLTRLAGDHGTEAAEVGYEAELVPEDNNSFDDKAIAVRISGNTVGYLSRDDARSFRRRLAQMGLSKQVTISDAVVVGGWVDRSGGKAHYGVKLDVKAFE